MANKDTTDRDVQVSRPRGPRDALRAPWERLRSLWERAPWWQRWIVYGVAIYAAFMAPHPAVGAFMTPDSDWQTILFYPIGVFVLLAVGLNVVVGQAGLLDLGYVAFFAVGAYTFAMFGTEYGWSFWPTVPIGIIVTGISGAILGAPTLRLRGDYLAIVTLGFGEIVRLLAKNTDWVGGARGIDSIPHPPSILGLEFGVIDPVPYYWLLLVMIILVIVFARRLQRSRIGRAWDAVREDEDAAELMGVPTFKFKLLSFFIGAMIGGFCGSLYSAKVDFIQPENFPFILSALILVCVVLGGSGNIPGVILGAFLVAWLPERFREFSDYRMLVFGGALVALMVFRPEGILPSRRRRAEMEEGTDAMGGGSGMAEVPSAESGGKVSL